MKALILSLILACTPAMAQNAPLSGNIYQNDAPDIRALSRMPVYSGLVDTQVINTNPNPVQFSIVVSVKEKEGGEATKILNWDEWHSRINYTARNAADYFRNMYHFPTGSGTVRLFVSSDHQMKARIERSSGNPDCDQCALAIYNSLNGTDVLEYPQDSKRKSFSYVVSFSFNGTSPTTANQMYGDREIIKVRW